MSDGHVTWMTAAPFWADAASAADAAAGRRLRQPAILRFASDSFMDDLMTTLDVNPAKVSELRAHYETWRTPGADHAPPARTIADLLRIRDARAGTGRFRMLAPRPPAGLSPAVAAPADEETPLKLYQPAHQRYYLVAACLVCREPGLPDRVVNAGNQERATYVVRRVRKKADVDFDPRDPGTWDEFAYCGQDRDRHWRKLPAEHVERAAPDEEQNGLFPLSYVEADGRKRRLLGGLIPVGKREAYVGARGKDASGKVIAERDVPDSRAVAARRDVIEPWKGVLDQLETARKAIASESSAVPLLTDEEKAKARARARADAQLASWYVLLDFASFLRCNLPNVWQAINGDKPAPALTAEQQDLLKEIGKITVGDALKRRLGKAAKALSPSLDVALKAAMQAKTVLDNAGGPFDGELGGPWPAFRFPLADPEEDPPLPLAPLPPPADKVPAGESVLATWKYQVDWLETRIVAALTGPKQDEGLPLAAKPPLAINEPAWFAIRMVYERPLCGDLQPTVMSAPTEAFQMAGFFDPEAPARPIRIALPIDTTPGGLRKFDKNTAFMISDVLCGQIKRAKGMTLGDLVRAVLPFPFHKDLAVPDKGPCHEGSDPLGMMCSLSIPIITLCALILLMIIVSLLDLIFHWLPFFIMCFPLPKFGAKDQGA